MRIPPLQPRRGILVLSFLTALVTSVAGFATPANFKIPAQPAADALLAFSKQASIEVVFSFDDLRRCQANAIDGRYEAGDALGRLLAGTGFSAVLENNGKWTVKKSEGPAAPKEPDLPKNEPRRRAEKASGPSTASDNPDEPVQLEAFTVTGSNIRRVEAETALPVAMIDREDIDIRGVSTMAELFETINIAEPAAMVESSYNAQGARGDIGTINLRGLGAGSTLALINGRRMAPFPIKTTDSGTYTLAANVNSIPSSLVSRVEILRDGASAIYGADAAAGVVNTIISSTYQGKRLRGRVAMTQHGGANEASFIASEGFNQGKTHIALSLEYYHRDKLMAADRSWSRDADQRSRAPAPWNGLPIVDANGTTVRDNDLNNRSTQTRYGIWQRGVLNTDGSFTGSRPAGNAGITTATKTINATTSTSGAFNYWESPTGEVIWNAGTAPSVNVDSSEFSAYTNTNQWRVLLPRTDRISFSTFFDRPINSRVSLFGDLMFYRACSYSGYEPVNFNFADGVDLVVPADNPWNPFGSRFYDVNGTPNADGTPRLKGTPTAVRATTAVRLDQIRPRSFESKSHQYRALAGLRGKLANDWEWESAVMFSGAQAHAYDQDTMRESWLRAALARKDASAYNPFGYSFKIVDNMIRVDKPYVNPDSVMNPLYWTAQHYGVSKLFVWDAKTNGQLWQLFDGGRIALATGAEIRWEAYGEKRPDYDGMNPTGASSLSPYLRDNDNDIVNSSANDPIDAQQTIYAAYAEVSFPFVTRTNAKPLVHGLELTFAGRFEHFSLFGQSTKPKASLVWSPLRWIKIRSSYNESFRTPNLFYGNSGTIVRYGTATDNYRYSVSGDATTDGSIMRRAVTVSNPNLKPEKSKSWVSGFIVDVPSVKGLAFTFDYWSISQNGTFVTFSAANTLAQDQLYLNLATQAELAKGVPIEQIDLGSGTANYKGYNVVRLPVTDADRAMFAAYNAKQPTNATKRAVVGQHVSTTVSYINLGGKDVEGYDIGFQYRLPRTLIGQFMIRGDVTHYLRRTSQVNATAPIISSLGQDGSAAWRSSMTLAWKRGNWNASWFATYFGTFVSTGAETTAAVYEALGRPSYIKPFEELDGMHYYLRCAPIIVHNATLAYRFPNSSHRWLRGVSLRGGLNNVFDKEPSATDSANGFQSGTINVRGRQLTLEIERAF